MGTSTNTLSNTGNKNWRQDRKPMTLNELFDPNNGYKDTHNTHTEASVHKWWLAGRTLLDH